jgi:hypothetical protein
MEFVFPAWWKRRPWHEDGRTLCCRGPEPAEARKENRQLLNLWRASCPKARNQLSSADFAEKIEFLGSHTAKPVAGGYHSPSNYIRLPVFFPH